MTPAHLLGRLMGYACCFGWVFAIPAGLVWLVLRKRAPSTGFAVPAPDASWKRFHAAGLDVTVPPGVHVEAFPGRRRIVLPSGYDYSIVPGDLAALIASRKSWLATTAERSEKRILLDAPDAFAYTAREHEWPDVSFVAGRRIGNVTWCVETHGSRVEWPDVRRELLPSDRATITEAERQLADALKRGEAPDGPLVKGLILRIAELSAPAARQAAARPSRVLPLTLAECAQGIAIVRALEIG